MDYIKAFIVGGIICIIGQILLAKTKLTSARILVIFVSGGCLLHGLGLYQWLVDFGGAGATVVLPGFGYSMAKGVMKEIDEIGALGILTGGLKAGSAGIAAAIVSGMLMSLIFNPKSK